MNINKNRINNIKYIKSKINNSSDFTIKNFPVDNSTITLIYSNSLTDSNYINKYILEFLSNNKNIKYNNINYFIENYIPNSSIKKIFSIENCLYCLYSGFTLIFIDNSITVYAIENKQILNSSIQKSDNERSLLGPNDSFTENYQINKGLIRKRLKTDKLIFKECIVGNLSKSKISIFYLKGYADEKKVINIYRKINNIKSIYIENSFNILNNISNTNRIFFPAYIETERPDYVCSMLLEKRIILLSENSNKAIILPCYFLDFFKSVDDLYETKINIIINKTVRIISFLLSIITPSLYISLMAYNIEAIPSNLLINLSMQKDGVPFTTLFEILSMNLMFQILRECDIRYPGKGSSSISIVGALVLGQAAVEAGIISPITIIVVGISSIAQLPFSSLEFINSIRIWQLFLILLSSLFGFVGMLIGLVIIISLIITNTSLKNPYFDPIEPFNYKKIKIKKGYKNE